MKNGDVIVSIARSFIAQLEQRAPLSTKDIRELARDVSESVQEEELDGEACAAIMFGVACYLILDSNELIRKAVN